MLVFIFLIVFYLEFSEIIAKFASKFYLKLRDGKHLELKTLRKNVGEFQDELQTLSQKDEFAKYARVERKLNKAQAEMTCIIADRKKRVQQLINSVKFFTYALYAIFTTTVLVMYRNMRCVEIPVPWLAPFSSIISFPLSSQGAISVPVWVVICRTVSRMAITCLAT